MLFTLSVKKERKKKKNLTALSCFNTNFKLYGYFATHNDFFIHLHTI